MMDVPTIQMISTIIILIVMLVVMVFSIIWFVVSCLTLKRAKKTYKDSEEILQELKEENKDNSTEYSDKLLGYIRMIIGQIAVLKFRTFQDNHKMDKITRIHIRELAEDVAKEAKDSINEVIIDFDDLLFTKEFYAKYIAETAIIIVKDIFEKSIDEIEE